MLEIYLLFLQSTLPVLTNANKFLQREEPLIHSVRWQLVNLIKKVIAKFMKPTSIAEALSKGELSSFSFADESHHLPIHEIWVGFQTKQSLLKLLDEGTISDRVHNQFLTAAKSFLVKVAQYLQKWCPINDELLSNAEWLDFEKRQSKNFMAVEYFTHKFPHLFHNMDVDLLAEQFMAYQILPDDAIPASVKTDAGLAPGDQHQADALWAYLATRKEPGTNQYEFDLLFKVASAVLTIPHSNAGEERIFSLINKNKTAARNSLLL